MVVQMAVAFSTDGSATIDKLLTNAADTLIKETDIASVFSLEQCVEWITEHGLTTIGLQIPDEYQAYAFKITKALEARSSAKFYILADTSYGSCCVDEVAGEHCAADGIIHFGHSCLSPTTRLPSLLVLKKHQVDVTACVNSIKTQLPDKDCKIVLLYDVAYFHAIEQLHDELSKYYSSLVTSTLLINRKCSIASGCQRFIQYSDKSPPEDQQQQESASVTSSESADAREKFLKPDKHLRCCNRSLELCRSQLDAYTIVYLGQESLVLSNLLLLWNQCKIYSFNPLTNLCRLEGLASNRALMKRYYLVEKAKDARIIGIVVGTLGVANYLEMINHVKSLLKKAGKKHYTFAVGKLNVAKLANFMEIDVYVLVACHENSLLDSAEFYRPVITPHELELACNPQRHWDGGIVTDFQQLLPGGDSHVALPDGDISPTVDVSLVTGNMRTLGVQDEDDQKQDGGQASSALMLRNQNTQLTLANTAQSAGDFLSQRSWKGLDPQLGKSEVVKAERGRRGIAIAYEEEPEADDS